MNEDPPPPRLLRLRSEIAELSATVRQLERAGLDDAAARLLISRKRAELEDLSQRAKRASKKV